MKVQEIDLRAFVTQLFSAVLNDELPTNAINSNAKFAEGFILLKY